MDRTKANNLIAAVLFGVLFLIIVLYIHGRISHLAESVILLPSFRESALFVDTL